MTGTVCNPELFQFPAVKKRRVTGSFTGGDVTSDGGLPLLRQLDRRLGLTKAMAQALPDPRDLALIEHSQHALLRQRIYGLCHGYEDLNDHDTLRLDPVWQTAVEQIKPLASSPTLCRLENRADRAAAWALHGILVDQFIASFRTPPTELILDFDATDDRVHGRQEGAHFHGYYGDYCFLPLYVFCGEQLLVAYLRPGNSGAARHAWAVLKLLVQRLRQAWPQVKIIFRGDSGFCRWRLLRWCEQHDVHYLVGLAQNPRLLAAAQSLMTSAAQAFNTRQEKQRHFGEVQYAAAIWDTERRVIYCEGRTHRQGQQTALPGHQPHRARAGTLRRSLLRAGRDGEPDQGAAVGFVCRPDQLPRLVGQPVPAVAVELRLCAAGTLARPRSGWNRTGAGAGRDDPLAFRFQTNFDVEVGVSWRNQRAITSEATPDCSKCFAVPWRNVRGGDAPILQRGFLCRWLQAVMAGPRAARCGTLSN